MPVENIRRHLRGSVHSIFSSGRRRSIARRSPSSTVRYDGRTRMLDRVYRFAHAARKARRQARRPGSSGACEESIGVGSDGALRRAACRLDFVRTQHSVWVRSRSTYIIGHCGAAVCHLRCEFGGRSSKEIAPNVRASVSGRRRRARVRSAPLRPAPSEPIEDPVDD